MGKEIPQTLFFSVIILTIVVIVIFFIAIENTLKDADENGQQAHSKSTIERVIEQRLEQEILLRKKNP